jgi:hypothetical protein
MIQDKTHLYFTLKMDENIKVYLTPVMSEDIYGGKTMFWCLKRTVVGSQGRRIVIQ